MVSRRDLWNYEPPLTWTIHKEILFSTSPGGPPVDRSLSPDVDFVSPEGDFVSPDVDFVSPDPLNVVPRLEQTFPSRGKVYEVSLSLGQGHFNKSLEEASMNILSNLSTLYAIVIVFADPFTPKTHNRVKSAISQIVSITEGPNSRKVEIFVNPMKRGWRCHAFERSCEKMGVSITVNFLENSMIKSGWTDLPSRREPRNFFGGGEKKKSTTKFSSMHLCLWGTMGQGYGWYPPGFLETLTREIFVMSRRYRLTKVFIDFRIRPYSLFSSPGEEKPYFCLPALELKRPIENDFLMGVEEYPMVVSPIYGDLDTRENFPREPLSNFGLDPREQEYLNFLLPQDSPLKISVWVIIKEWLLVLKMIDRRIP
jgi:hypothetical protein